MAEATKDFLRDFAMFFHCLCEDEDVVHVDDENVATNEVAEDVVHHVLERCRGVRETEEHDRRFEEAAVGDERRFPLVAFLDADVVEAPRTSILEKTLASLILLMTSETRGNGQLSRIVHSLRRL